MSWENQTTRDTGNGAIVHVSTSRQFAGVKQYEFVSYCGREENKVWYEAVGDEQRLEFSAPRKATERYSECVRLRDQARKIEELDAKMARR